LFTLLFIIVPQGNAAVQLSDIDGHWAESAIQKMADTGVASGFPDATFKPDNKISRAEFAALIVKVFKLESKNGKVFSDTSRHWAKDYISTASAYGIVNGYNDDVFRPDNQISREEMAIMIVKAANTPISSEVPDCMDSDQISSWAKNAVAAAYANHIITGMEDGSFRPLNNATRAEAVIVLINGSVTRPVAEPITYTKSAVMGYVFEVTFNPVFTVEDAMIRYTNTSDPTQRDFFASTSEGGNVYRYLADDTIAGDIVGFYVNGVLEQTINIEEEPKY